MKNILKNLLLFCLSVLLCALFLCSCGKQNKDPEHTHTFGEWITTKESTCNENGVMERYCICLEKETTLLPLGAHTPEEIFTCNWGQVCSVCNTVLRQPNDHQYGEFVVIQPSTCKVNGEKKQTCTVCGDTVYKTIYAPGHKYGDAVLVKEATCAEPGLRERACVCGEKISETIPVEHTGEWTVTKEQTKIEDGFREIDCSVCNQKITEVLYATGSSGLAYWTYPDTNTCTIIGIGTCTDEDVVIPSVIEGCTVTTIAENAFKDCKTMVSLWIPASVTNIGDHIVFGASNLTTLYYNASFDCHISSFMGAPIKKIVYGGSFASKLTDTVEEVVISENTTSIKNDAFSGCYSLKSVIIPSSVTSIGYQAFYNCNNLKDVSLPTSVTSIGFAAFYGCQALTDIVIPEGVTELGNMLFFACDSLTNVVIPSTVTKIEGSAFSGCTALTSITVPSGVTEIGEDAFGGCQALTDIVIPESVTVIASNAFSYCTSLTNIVLPASVKHINMNAFYNCTALKNITFGGTKAEWNSIQKGMDWMLWSGLERVTCSDGPISLK